MRLRGYFELLRPANVVTAMGDPLAGFLLAGGSISNWRLWTPALATSACLYAAGVALNDVFDAAEDRINRPARPIPSGRVPRNHATAIVLLLSLAALCAAWYTDARVTWTASALLLCIFLYNAVLKHSGFAPAVMGCCRALNIAIGMVAAGTAPTLSQKMWPVALMWLYVSSITVFARSEYRCSERWRLAAALTGIVAAFGGQVCLYFVIPTASTMQLVWPVIAALWCLCIGVQAIKDPSPQRVQTTVTGFLLFILVFDACLVVVTRGFTLSVMVLAFYIPAYLLSRSFRMT